MNSYNVAPNLWIVKDCFDPETLIWLSEIKTNTENLFSVTRPHLRLLLENSNDHNRLQSLGLYLLPGLSELTGQNLNFMVAKFWLDLPGFGCQVHHDAPDIIVTLQVYIDSDGDTVGAEFLHVDPSIQIPIQPNCGYINLNTDLKDHQVIANNGTRTSVVFQYNVIDS
jgi:hypothetical protein